MRKADNLPPSCAVVTKSGSLNFLEPSGPVQACNGTAFLGLKEMEFTHHAFVLSAGVVGACLSSRFFLIRACEGGSCVGATAFYQLQSRKLALLCRSNV